MAQMININADEVNRAVSEISAACETIKTELNKFIADLEAKNNDTQGKFALLKQLNDKVAIEKANVDNLNNAVEDINQTLARYVEAAEAVNDDSAFR